ncbi:MAG TPA: 3'-5' exonuclease [Rectinemataceae bacterium]
MATDPNVAGQSPSTACLLPDAWEGRKYAAFDVETTGLDPSRDRILEIGLVLFSFDSEGALTEETSWSSLVNPAMAIPPSSTSIHGITDLDVSQAPFFSEVASRLAELLSGRILVAHNASFDMDFLRNEYSRLSLPCPTAEFADTLLLSRQAFPGLFSYNLGKAAFLLGIEAGSAHRALDDARTCMRLYARAARTIAGACP